MHICAFYPNRNAAAAPWNRTPRLCVEQLNPVLPQKSHLCGALTSELHWLLYLTFTLFSYLCSSEFSAYCNIVHIIIILLCGVFAQRLIGKGERQEAKNRARTNSSLVASANTMASALFFPATRTFTDITRSQREK